MTLANLDGASVSGAAEKLKGILAEPSEPTQPQGESPKQASQPEPINEQRVQETQQNVSDTEAPSRRRKAKLGDREIEFEVLTDDVDLDLIPKGLMMENDYRQKTMSLSDEKKAFDAQKSEFDAKLAELTDMVMFGADNLESDEMKELKEVDPNSYWEKFDEVKSKAEKLKAYKDARDKELMTQQQKAVEAEVAKYTQLIPEWLDETQKTKDVEKMVSFLGNSGFTEQEVGSIYDARIMSIVRKAALYDEISSQNIEAKRVQSVPKSSRPSSTTQKAEKTAQQKSMERLRQTGKLDDASAAIRNLLGG